MDFPTTRRQLIRFSTLAGFLSIGLQAGCATLVGGMTMATNQEYEIVDTKGPKKVTPAEPHEIVMRLADTGLENDRVLVGLEEHNLCVQTSVFTDKYRRTSVAVDSPETGPIPDIVSMPLYVAGTYGLGWGAMALAAEADSPFEAQTRTALVMNIIMASELVVTGIYGLQEFKSENRDETEVVTCSDWAPSTQISKASVTLGERSLPVEYNTETHTLEVPASVFGAVMLEHRDLATVDAVVAQLSIQRDASQGILPARLDEQVSITASSLKQQAMPWRCEALAQPFSTEILNTHPPAHVGALLEELEDTCSENVDQARAGLCGRSKADALNNEPSLLDLKRNQPHGFSDIYTYLENCEHSDLWKNKLNSWLSHTFEQIEDGTYASDFQTGMRDLDALRKGLPQYTLMFGDAWVSDHASQLEESLATFVLAEKTRLEKSAIEEPNATHIAALLSFSGQELSGNYPPVYEQVQETGRQLVTALLTVNGAALGMGESSYSPSSDLEALDQQVESELQRVEAASGQWTEFLGEDFVASLNAKAIQDATRLKKTRVKELQAEERRIAQEERAAEREAQKACATLRSGMKQGGVWGDPNGCVAHCAWVHIDGINSGRMGGYNACTSRCDSCGY